MLLRQKSFHFLCKAPSITLVSARSRSQHPVFFQPSYLHCTNQARMSSSSPKRPDCISLGAELLSQSGITYTIQEVLAERPEQSLGVYCASAEGTKYIVKRMIPGEFEYQHDLQKRLASCPNLRTVVDTVRDLELFIYPFLTGDVLRFSRKTLSEEQRKHILRCALIGLSGLHAHGIIHTDIKPNNILLNYEAINEDDVSIQSVQISDLEDSVLLPPGKNLKGCLCGNQLWRSPESWARARQNTPSDIFSFGLVAIYVMLDDMVMLVNDEELNADDAWRHILRRHISFFGEEDGFKGLLEHIGEDNPFFERLIALAGDFDAERPRKPFLFWHYVDADFRDLIGKMTVLDPARRITAQEALEHPWFHRRNTDSK